ncbi:hypothetical protein [Mycobacterium sp. 050134]
MTPHAAACLCYSPVYWRLMQVLFRIRPIRRLGRGLQYHFGSQRGV